MGLMVWWHSVRRSIKMALEGKRELVGTYFAYIRNRITHTYVVHTIQRNKPELICWKVNELFVINKFMAWLNRLFAAFFPIFIFYFCLRTSTNMWTEIRVKRKFHLFIISQIAKCDTSMSDTDTVTERKWRWRTLCACFISFDSFLRLSAEQKLLIYGLNWLHASPGIRNKLNCSILSI